MNFDTESDHLFYQSLRIRLIEEKVIELYPSDKIQSPVHLSIGQEAVAVGVCADLRLCDLLFGNYRGHAWYLAKGGDLKQFFAELYGKVTGCGRGKAGSMHLAAPDVGFMGSSAVVASSIPHAVGAALAAKIAKKDQVIVTVFGDGATDEGVYHESLNFAALRKVPLIFLCENNGLAVHSTHADRQSYQIGRHAAVYGIEVHSVQEGWDPERVREGFQTALRRLKVSGEPQFLEVATYRYKEHVGVGEDFDAGYRRAAQCAAWKERDPLCRDAERVARFRPILDKEIAEAVAFAEASAWPGAEELLMHVE